MAPKVMIAVPMMGTVRSEFLLSLVSMANPGGAKLAVEANSLVYAARNSLTVKALENGYDYILWIDSDMTFPPEMLLRLLEDAESMNLDYVSGLYFSRRYPTRPLILKDIQWERDEETGIIKHGAEMYWDYPEDSVFPIAGSGLGCVLMRTELAMKVAEAFMIPAFDPLPSFGEDYSFCWRLKQLGVKMWCDSRVKLGHVGTMIYDENVYRSQGEHYEENRNG